MVKLQSEVGVFTLGEAKNDSSKQRTDEDCRMFSRRFSFADRKLRT